MVTPDSIKEMTTNPAEWFEGPQKKKFLSESIPFINSALGKGSENSIDNDEINAIGFVIDRSVNKPIEPSQFVTQTLGIQSGQPPKDIAWLLHSRIHETRVRRIRELMGENTNNSGEIKKLQATLHLMESSHSRAEREYSDGAEVYLGSIPEFLLPDWLK